MLNEFGCVVAGEESVAQCGCSQWCFASVLWLERTEVSLTNLAPLLPHLAFKGDRMEFIQPDFPNSHLLTKSLVESIDNSNTTLVSLGRCGVSQLTLFLLHKTSDLVFSTLFIIHPNQLSYSN